MADSTRVEKAYEIAREQYAELGVDTDQALQQLATIRVSVHCWQGDDVVGFEHKVEGPSGGIMATGNYPGRARNADELRSDLEAALRLIPGKHRVNLHAMYLESNGQPVERDQIEPKHFARWADWAADHGLGLDFNPTFFAHPKAADGFTLAHPDESIRQFWVRHGIACRKIGEFFGKRLQTTCITNVWIPDGFKDVTIDRKGPRERLQKSLDEIFAVPVDPAANKDAIEGKLFGIGSETYVVGSHEFYLAYAVKNQKLLCLDAGHYHPTEQLADKLSAVLLFLDEVLLHVSRPVRWDSDHVVIFNDDVRSIAEELVRGNFLERVHIGLDFFDASINRVAAWVIGTRAMLKALLWALLEPTEKLKQVELEGNLTTRLALTETLKTLPFGSVWDYYCLRQGVPLECQWPAEIKRYEQQVLSVRS